MSKWHMWWADSRGKVIVILLALWVGALMASYRTEYIYVPMIAVVGMVLCDGGIAFLRKRQSIVTLSTVISGLLIGLIFDPMAGILPLLVACLIASVGKQVVGAGDHRHVFNPATLGILGSSLLFARGVSWWGGAWGMGAVIILALGMGWVLYGLRRLWMPISFLLVYFIQSLLFVSVQSALQLTFDGTVFLFAFVMLPEPISSVSGAFWRYGWGALVGAFVLLQSVLHFYVVDQLLLALLAANAIGFFVVRLPFITRSSVQTV